MNCYVRQFNVSSDKPCLVLLHGLFGMSENLNAIAKPLSEHFSVYSFDLPAHGRSQTPAFNSLAEMAALLAQDFDEMRLDNFHLLGHSLGGKLAIELSSLQSEYQFTITSLIVLDMAPAKYARSHDGIFEGLFALDLSQLQSRKHADDILSEYVDELSVRSFLLKNLYKDENKHWQWRFNLQQLFDAYENLLSSPNAANGDSSEVEVLSVSQPLSLPALFIKGQNSNYINEKNYHTINALFPNAQLKVVQGAGHWIHAEKPEVVNRLVERYLQNL